MEEGEGERRRKRREVQRSAQFGSWLCGAGLGPEVLRTYYTKKSDTQNGSGRLGLGITREEGSGCRKHTAYSLPHAPQECRGGDKVQEMGSSYVLVP